MMAQPTIFKVTTSLEIFSECSPLSKGTQAKVNKKITFKFE